MNYQIYPEIFLKIGLWGGGTVNFQNLIFSHRANVRKNSLFHFWMKKCPHRFSKYFYRDSGILCATYGIYISQVPATIQNLAPTFQYENIINYENNKWLLEES